MITSSSFEANSAQFEDLLSVTISALHSHARDNPRYFKSRNAEKLEQDVYEAINDRARGSIFENSIKLHSGHSFPDIVAKGYWGLEVKSSQQSQWKCTGNSVLESTRVQDVGRIYLLFGKLSTPIGFRYKRYEECLYDIAVTHSPRYLIDMDTAPGKSIFNKMRVEYDILRKEHNPIRMIIQHYRRELKKKNTGEDLWWLETDDGDVPSQSVTVKLWGKLPQEKREDLRIQALALFPEIFGKDGKKYARLATWLAGTHGVVAPSLRDAFTAGGQVQLTVEGTTYYKVPKIFKHLQDDLPRVISAVKSLDNSEIEYYWGKNVPKGKRIKEWEKMVKVSASNSLKDCHLDIEKMIHNQLD